MVLSSCPHEEVDVEMDPTFHKETGEENDANCPCFEEQVQGDDQFELENVKTFLWEWQHSLCNLID